MTSIPTLLVTGGAGYIGSHLIKQLEQQNIPYFILDNLSTGSAEFIDRDRLIVGDINDVVLLKKLFEQHHFQTIIHLAANSVVPESLENPVKYYQNNTFATLQLLQVACEFNLKNFIFSSTAAVYGVPSADVVDENTTPHPINPYGRSKLAAEWIIEDMAKRYDFNYINLRYFNVAGAHLSGETGQFNSTATQLIKVVCQVATGKKSQLKIFGDDYPTKDGTCIRDYIHVEDLAQAHLSALTYLEKYKTSQTLNVGYGHGYSVLEIIKAMNAITQQSLPYEIDPRRAGDPAHVVADNKKITKLFHWQPQYDDLNIILKSALAWEQKIKD